MKRKHKLLRFGLSLLTVAAAMLVALPATAQEISGTPGSPSATEVIKGDQLPPPPLPFGGVIKDVAKDSKPYWPPTVVPPQGCAQRAAHHDRRPGLRRLGDLWRRHSDADDGPAREDGLALHAVPLHGTLLADARGVDHRPQPSLGRLRRDRRTIHRLPGLRFASSKRTAPPSARFSRTTATPPRGSARTTTRRPINTASPGPSICGRAVSASSTSMGSWAVRPTSGRPISSAITRRSSRGSASPTTT